MRADEEESVDGEKERESETRARRERDVFTVQVHSRRERQGERKTCRNRHGNACLHPALLLLSLPEPFAALPRALVADSCRRRRRSFCMRHEFHAVPFHSACSACHSSFPALFVAGTGDAHAIPNEGQGNMSAEVMKRARPPAPLPQPVPLPTSLCL